MFVNCWYIEDLGFFSVVLGDFGISFLFVIGLIDVVIE